VPNPAQPVGTAKWLNGALMVRRQRTFLAIADAMRLKHIVERQLVGDSLRTDPQRARSDHVDLCLPEPGRTAFVVDPSRARTIAENAPRAILAAMLELGERQNVGDTLPNCSLVARSSGDLPQTPADLCQRSGLHGGQSRGREGDPEGKNHRAAHQQQFSTRS